MNRNYTAWEEGQGKRAFNHRQLTNKHVVTIGGGTGPFGVLSNLKHYPCAITAIVTMADSGGSSRRLMDEFGQLPFGDLRQALVALSRKGVLWRDVFNYRFEKNNNNGGRRNRTGVEEDQHASEAHGNSQRADDPP
ncbi:MAG: gluconeogenesis factor YvcK family protein [Ktedonobacterales bacterium]